jgi:hypothetical protein
LEHQHSNVTVVNVIMMKLNTRVIRLSRGEVRIHKRWSLISVRA